MGLAEQLRLYRPFNEQEQADQALILGCFGGQ